MLERRAYISSQLGRSSNCTQPLRDLGGVGQKLTVDNRNVLGMVGGSPDATDGMFPLEAGNLEAFFEQIPKRGYSGRT